MSTGSDAPVILQIPYIEYRVAVYCNVVTGFIYGEGKENFVTSPISKPFCRAYDHRCLYHSLHYFGLRPPVSHAFEGIHGKDDTC